jgi:hypothetical protein
MANLRIVNGLGSTDTANALGNLIIGYNELRDDRFNTRTGSHNLVVGKRDYYSSYGGVVFGLFNHASGPHGTICGGSGNKPLGFAASVTGGGRQKKRRPSRTPAVGGRCSGRP